MSNREKTRLAPPNCEQGSALVIALALVMALTILVAATQLQVVDQLKVAKTERNYERALEMAEAGGNAYLNMLARGPASASPNAGLLPQPYTLGSLLSLNDFKAAAKNGTIPSANLIYYPAGQTQQGYFAAQIGTIGATGTIVSYGWCNGVVRRIKYNIFVKSIFDWTALWGMDPNPGDYAWTVIGGASIVGGAGGEGLMRYSNNIMFYDGPIVQCTPSAVWSDSNGNNINPITNGQFAQSQPNIPTGHIGTGEVANPPLLRFRRPLGFPTADDAANDWASEQFGVTTTAGVSYFKGNHNDDATGIRYVMQNTDGTLYELNPGGNSAGPAPVYPAISGYLAPVTAAKDYFLDFSQASKNVQSMQKTNTLPGAFYGLRFYPGNYYLTGSNMSQSDFLFLRTYNDGDRADPAVTSARAPSIVGDPANPNSGMGGERNVRFWVGHAKTGGDPQLLFRKGTTMEYPRWPSRFRVYNASAGGVDVRGSASGPPFPFNVNMLNYNKTASGAYYGSIVFSSGVYLRGSLISWNVTVSGGTTLEKVTSELSQTDKLTYVMVNWTELP